MVYAFCLKYKLNHGVVVADISAGLAMSGRDGSKVEAAGFGVVGEDRFDAAVRAELAGYATVIEPLYKNLPRASQPSDFADTLVSFAGESNDS
jgi:hypothetical protein